MPRFALFIATTVLFVGFALGPVDSPANSTLATGQHPPDLEAQVDRWYLDAMDAIYRGRASEATQLADAMEQAVPEDPRPYLLRARILRLDIPDQNADREGIGAYMGPSKEVLQKAVVAADGILQRDPESLAGHLYRGWALMFLAQIHALSDEYWGAGRKAAAGKADLDFVLERDPGNADALLVQGVYLYFADILPGMVKFARVFLRVPGGHRERGMEYIEAATIRHGYAQLDAKALLGVVLFAFEGRIEDATRQFDKVLAEYPGNTRMMEPLSVMAMHSPQAMSEAMARTGATIQNASNSQEQTERKVAARLQLYLSLQEILAGRVESARERLDALSRNLPREPDWLEPDVMRFLVDLDRMLADDAQARSRVESLPDKSPLRHKLMRNLQGPMVSESVRSALLALQPAARALYAGRLDETEAALATLPDVEAPFIDFYRGELELLRLRPDAALPYFTGLANDKSEDCWYWFRYCARLRVAEIHGARGQREIAARTLQKAMDIHEQRDLLRHVARARKHFYENGGAAGAGTAERHTVLPAQR